MFRPFSLSMAMLTPVMGFWLAAKPVAKAQPAANPKATSATLAWFEREVRPIFAEHCSSCHSGRVGNLRGGLSLDDRESMLTGGESGPAIVPGKPKESLLIEAVRRESFEMPPEKPLSDRELKILERWVAVGAPWPQADPAKTVADGDWLHERLAEHWAWQPVRKPQVPVVEDDHWSGTMIDRFIFNKLNEAGLSPAEPGNSHALFRRLSFDLTGLPPSRPTEVAADSPAYVRQVDQFLSSPQFGVRWGRSWLDLVRYAETLGHEFDYPIRHAWRYRDAVIDALNVDVPYRRFVAEHLAGDQLEPVRRHPLTGMNQSLVLTGFWWLGDAVHAPVDLKNDLATRLENQIDVFSKTFLGMTIACARCHDHKFDALSMHDYYGLAGVLESTRREYALTDPTDALAQHWAITAERLDEANRRARSALLSWRMEEAEMRAWLEEYLSILETLDDENRNRELSLASPFYALRVLLSEEPIDEAFQSLGENAVAAERQFQLWQAESELLADFSAGIPPDWTLSATRYSPGMTAAMKSRWLAPENPRALTFDWYSEQLPLPNRFGLFSSQRFGRHSSVQLTSPSFGLERDMICIKMRGQSTQSSVVLEHYFMNEFHNLLFKDSRKPIQQLRDGGWVTHAGDLNKYRGSPTYLTLYDEDQAWFEIEQVRLADRAPPVRPHRLSFECAQRSYDSSEALKRALVEQLVAAWEHVQNLAQSDFKKTSQPVAEQEKEERNALISIIRACLQASSQHGLELPNMPFDLGDEARRLQTLDQQTPPPTSVLAATEGTPCDVRVNLRGNPHETGETVPRGCLFDLETFRPASSNSSGRRELAEAVTDPRHPLTARVMVNRVWHHLMGHGLVRSPDNFGVLGGRPTHPKLLDYLASEFVAHDWSIKWLVREIVLSKTYQLSSLPSEEQLRLDAEARLWSHRPVRRLTAEALRDALLAAADSLDHALGGPSVPVHLTAQMTGRGRPKESGPLDGDNRRSAYLEIRRNFLDPLLVAFDQPMPSTAVGGRSQSNVPAQALGLLNDPLVLEMSRRWAASTKSIRDPTARAKAMIETAFSRPATNVEIERALRFVSKGENAWRELAHILMNSKEFSYLR